MEGAPRSPAPRIHLLVWIGTFPFSDISQYDQDGLRLARATGSFELSRGVLLGSERERERATEKEEESGMQTKRDSARIRSQLSCPGAVIRTAPLFAEGEVEKGRVPENRGAKQLTTWCLSRLQAPRSCEATQTPVKAVPPRVPVYHILSRRVVSCRIASRRVISCLVMGCHVVACHAMSYHNMHDIMPYRTVNVECRIKHYDGYTALLRSRIQRMA